jgi:hypothetical protein
VTLSSFDMGVSSQGRAGAGVVWGALGCIGVDPGCVRGRTTHGEVGTGPLGVCRLG